MSSTDDVNEFTAYNGSYTHYGVLDISPVLLTRKTIDDYSSNDLIKWDKSKYLRVLKAFYLNESSYEALNFA